jgi:hypothetical protein
MVAGLIVYGSIFFLIIYILGASGLWIVPVYFLGAFVIVPLVMIGIYQICEKSYYSLWRFFHNK